VDDVLGSFESMKVGLRAFQKYVPVRLVRQLLEGRQEPALGGEVRTLTILFSDIKGFTSISERLAPLELARQLGDYLSVVTRRIQDRQGTVDKYIGDAVMAFWGAPHEVPDHAFHACAAILEALADLERQAAEKPFLKEFHTRIGIHTASVVVGNFGCEDRLNYTVIGDGVNLASRLEGLNKVFGTQVMLSEDTAALVSDRFVTRRLAQVAVVGRTRPVTVSELIGEASSVTEERRVVVRMYEEALDLYHRRDFSGALGRLEELLALAPEDAPSAWLAGRCRICLESPLPPAWTGVITMEGK
jgi:adenylate cyclase